jgi:hypothetical protein
MKEARQKEALLEMFRRAYAASTPPGDFDKLMAESPKNDSGEVLVPYDDYECDHNTLETIVSDVFKEYRVPHYLRQRFRFSFFLGAAPRTKREILQ